MHGQMTHKDIGTPQRRQAPEKAHDRRLIEIFKVR